MPATEYKNLKRKLPSVGEQQQQQQQPQPQPNPNKKQRLLATRKSLPIWPRLPAIRAALRTHQILLLAGETGSGKSTQVPQCLLHEPWLAPRLRIAVTQPRRVAAISLARRVADELGSPLGGPRGAVGYSVRFDSCAGPATRVKFLTEGMLLQELLRDPDLGEYGAVVVDEVHERGVDVDLLLGFLSGLVRRRRELRVVVMSATADLEALERFFAERGGDGAGAGRAGVEEAGLDGGEDVGNGANGNEGSGEEVSKPETKASSTKVTRLLVEGRQYPVKLHYLDKPATDVWDKAFERIFLVHCKEAMPGDILVFADGAEKIESLRRNIEEFAQNLTKEYPKVLVLPLYAALPQAAQQRIFEKAPPNTRKIILSTNIAETSVTVPGVRFVVDTGRVKIKQYRSRLGLESLLAKPISKSSAEQRKGRAGREAPGQCYRLFTEETFNSLDQDMKPEILRCDLSSAALKMKARGVDDILSFPFLTPLPTEAIRNALLQLHHLGCLDDHGKITSIGRQIARLPLAPSRGRVLLEAARPERNCLLEAIDIVACLEVDTIWLPAPTEEAREAAQDARARLLRRPGDHLTLLAAVQAYDAEPSDRRAWAAQHRISHRAMRTVMDVRKQLRAQCKALATTPATPTVRAAGSATDEATQENVLKCFLRGCDGHNLAWLAPDRTYRTFASPQTVAIHPSSVLFHRKPLPEGILYDEFVFTNRAYARGVSAVRLAWLEELPGFQRGDGNGDGDGGSDGV